MFYRRWIYCKTTYPELTDSESASRLIRTFEEKDQLKRVLRDVGEAKDAEHDGIQVFIGDETPVPDMADCSMVTANYDLGGGLRGTIGIVGPKRMDYEKVFSTLRTVMKQLDGNFEDGGDGSAEGNGTPD